MEKDARARGQIYTAEELDRSDLSRFDMLHTDLCPIDPPHSARRQRISPVFRGFP
jgi:hypothetical protein